MSCRTLAALLLVATRAHAQQLELDRPIEIEFSADDLILAEHGASRSFDYQVESEGTLYLWAASAQVDPFLRLTNSIDGSAIEDDDAGGGTTAFLFAGIAPGAQLRITVAADIAGTSGKLLLHAGEARETEVTRAAAGSADTARVAIEEARAAGDFDQARTLATRAIEGLLAVEGGRTSRLVADAAWHLGQAAYSVSEIRGARAAWDFVLAFRARFLPGEHKQLQVARGSLAIASATLGDLHGARSLLEQVLNVGIRTLSDDDPDLQTTRQNLAATLRELGDLKGAQVLLEKVIEVTARTRPEAHADIVGAKLNLASVMLDFGDVHGARALSEETLATCLRAFPEEHRFAQAARRNLAVALKRVGDRRGACDLEAQVLEIASRSLPDDHPGLQSARQNLANTLKSLGDLPRARELQAKVLEVRLAVLPPDHADLQAARLNLATTIGDLGDLAGARALQEQAVEVLELTRPVDDTDLQGARLGLASTLGKLGELQRARALQEQALAALARALPEDSAEVLHARMGLAGTLHALREHTAARAEYAAVLEAQLRNLPDDDPELQKTRVGLAVTLCALGDLPAARELEQRALTSLARSLPDDHPELQAARLNLANTLRQLGDLVSARVLEEQVLEVLTRTLPDDHPDLQAVRNNLAITTRVLGDLQRSRALLERVLEVSSRRFSDDHADLQSVRGNLAVVLNALGDEQGALALDEKVVEIWSRTLPEEHHDLLAARLHVAEHLQRHGDLSSARLIGEQVCEVWARTLPAGHPDLQMARQSLAGTLFRLGELNAARALQQHVHELCSRTLPDDHPQLQAARRELASTLAAQRAAARDARGVVHDQDDTRFEQLARAFAAGLRRGCAAAILDASSREAEERVAACSSDLGMALSLAEGMGSFASDPGLNASAFLASETARGAALTSARLARRAGSDPDYGALRERMRTAGADLASLAHGGADAADIAAARARLDAAERDIARAAGRLSGDGGSEIEPSLARFASHLEPDQALVAYRRYERTVIEAGAGSKWASTDCLCAFVMRPRDGDPPGSQPRLDRVELGPIDAIEAAVERWRASLGGTSGRGVTQAPAGAGGVEATMRAGESLRALVLDPLSESLAGIRRVTVALDDLLHSVPMDALPAGGPWRVPRGSAVRATGPELLGACLRIEMRASLLELLAREPPSSGPPTLVALGGASFQVPPDAEGAHATSDVASAATAARIDASHVDPSQPKLDAGPLRGSAWETGFATLPGTSVEVHGIGAAFQGTFGPSARCNVLEGPLASRGQLAELAPAARYLHVATHGWFAAESIRSFQDSAPIDERLNAVKRESGADRIRGMSPMLLCGLALAGANLPADAAGRSPGLITAEEIATLHLANCELAVLSACDTNVGVQRAGQGVASLQKALQMAGARSVITSLWKVPDEATKELMLDFYRRLWVEKEPKWQALWEAKMKLRNAKDAEGRPQYSTRDWAAWVLTGEPD